MKFFFVTGTDTDIGKTTIAVALLNKFNTHEFSTFAIKPIASGCQLKAGVFYNDDALALQAAASVKKPYLTVNPISFEPPIAPHIAASQCGIRLSEEIVVAAIRHSIQPDVDVHIIEGAGGWHVPLNDRELVSDVVKTLDIPVILVVGIRLGCLNHALLTTRQMLHEGITLSGWVANCIDPNTKVVAENINTLKNWIKAPCLGVIPFGGKPEAHLDIGPLLSTHFNKVVSPEEKAF